MCKCDTLFLLPLYQTSTDMSFSVVQQGIARSKERRVWQAAVARIPQRDEKMTVCSSSGSALYWFQPFSVAAVNLFKSHLATVLLLLVMRLRYTLQLRS